MLNHCENLSGVPRPGDLIADRYRVERVIAFGGMSVIIKACDRLSGRLVAVKCLKPNAIHNQRALARFEREARVLANLHSEHVVEFLDHGQLPNGTPFMVLEFLEGCDLLELLRARRSLPIEEAVHYVLQTAVALAKTHRMGVVHRDLKPANLFRVLSDDGTYVVKVLDFGICRPCDELWESEPALTLEKSIVGSPIYMAPEQARDPSSVDQRTDIWALGVILHQLLTGDTPFSGSTGWEGIVQVATAAPKPLRARLPEAPAALEGIILRCLEKDPNRRFNSLAELATMLARFTTQGGQVLANRIAGCLADFPDSQQPVSSPRRLPPPRRPARSVVPPPLPRRRRKTGPTTVVASTGMPLAS